MASSTNASLRNDPFINHRINAFKKGVNKERCMKFALVCASHTPLLMREDLASADMCKEVERSFERMRAFVDEFNPDQIVQFSPDHFHGFHYDNMPPFCIGAGAHSCGDWGTKEGSLNVDEDFALDLLDAAREADIDLALSYDMGVDHGFVQLWETLFDGFNRYPIVPIFINAIAPPLPTYRRARLLGQAIGRRAAASGKRVLFAASGGLSHDPVVPKMKGADAALRERLLGRSIQGPEQQAKREAMVEAAAVAAIKGEGPVRPLNPQWDDAILTAISRADWPVLDALDPVTVDAEAGSGANEVLAWVAAVAALDATGDVSIVQRDYVQIPGWIAGMGHLAATSSAG